jgi:hypothetical protein
MKLLAMRKVRKPFLAAACMVLALSAGTTLAQTESKGVQLRIRVTNSAGFVIGRMTMKAGRILQNGNYIGTADLDTRETNFSLGETKNVAWDAKNGQKSPRWDSVNDIEVEYRIHAADITGVCRQPVDLQIKQGQITRVGLPNDTHLVRILNPDIDQIVRVDLEIKGTTTSRTCSYKGVTVRKR